MKACLLAIGFFFEIFYLVFALPIHLCDAYDRLNAIQQTVNNVCKTRLPCHNV